MVINFSELSLFHSVQLIVALIKNTLFSGAIYMTVISSSTGIATHAMQDSLNKARQNAQDIVAEGIQTAESMNTSPQHDAASQNQSQANDLNEKLSNKRSLEEMMVENMQIVYEIKTAAAIHQTGNEMMGSILDIFV